MKIALDYDGTYTADPIFWDVFATNVRLRGHEVRIVTVRNERFDRTQPLVDLEAKIPVIYTRGVAKAWYCTHFTDGWIADVWVDDSPKSILENSSATPDWLRTWRAERDEDAVDNDPLGR